MKRYLITSIAALIIAAFTPAMLSAQEYENTPVTISKEKVRIDGQVFYSHIVLEKQTLFSICKAYGVSAEDIYKHNPSVKETGLKKNFILIIPIAEAGEKKADDEKKATAAEQKQEAEQPQEHIQPQEQLGRRNHIVKWFEDLDSIAAKYGVSASEIMQANNLKTKKLSRRQRLVIPIPGEYEEEVIAEKKADETSDEMAEVTDTAAEDTSEDSDVNFLFPKNEVSLTLVMPFKADGNSGSKQNMDFYSGVLLAVHDAQKEGISTDLDVYDIADGGGVPDAVTKSDVVIGPVASGDISRIYESFPSIDALVSPLDPRAESLAYGKESMIHAPTPHSAQYDDLVSWIKEDMKTGDRILFITEKGAQNNAATMSMTAAMDSSGLAYKPLAYSILEGRNITNTLAYLMTETGTNRVYIASESEAFVNDVVRNLNVMIHQKYEVVLYAPSKIRGFDTIEVENFHNTNMHVSLGYYIDYNDPKVMDFLLKYRALFNTEPTQFAYQGYDIARYFITNCSKYGKRWMEKLDENNMSMLQSTFSFIRTPDGGYINNGVRRIIYGDNWTVEKIR